jgi:hypothetical protein
VSAQVKDEFSCTLTMLCTAHRDSSTFTFYRDGSHILMYCCQNDTGSAGLYNCNVTTQSDMHRSVHRNIFL